jgi:hypothetical protein
MSATIKKIALLFASFTLVVFAVFVFNQTAQIVQTARVVSPVFGDGIMWALVFAYCLLLITPAVLWFRLPRRLTPPATVDAPGYDRFMDDFAKRLSRNFRLRGMRLDSTKQIEAAVQILDQQADDAVTSAASAVFLSTAVLQSGRLDTLVVLAAQTRLIWNVAHIYDQRPSLRDFARLYAHVAATAFIAAGLEDVDYDVLISTIFGSTVAAIPGMSILANSVLSGSANAFLTLRVGMITKEFCRCTVLVEQSGLRRKATVQAANLLYGIVRQGAAQLTTAVAMHSKSKVTDVLNRVTGRRNPVQSS